jgi:hypothetical protein
MAAWAASVMVPVYAAWSAWAKQQLSQKIHVTKRFFNISFLLNAKLSGTPYTGSAGSLDRLNSRRLFG